MIDPISLAGFAVTTGTGIWSMLEGKRAEKKAREANEQRRQQIIGLLRTQGEASKNEISMGAVNERSDISQGLINRGLYNTTTLDTLSNMSRSREARDRASVDERMAGQVAGFMNSWQDEGPDMSGSYAAIGKAGALAGSMVYDALKGGQPGSVAPVKSSAIGGAGGVPAMPFAGRAGGDGDVSVPMAYTGRAGGGGGGGGGVGGAYSRKPGKLSPYSLF